MKVKFTLEKEESKALRQILEDMPVDVCSCINHCPEDNAGNDMGCEGCPIQKINDIFEKARKDVFAIIVSMEN